MIPKEHLVTIPESMNALDAVNILEDMNLRQAPIVDASNNLYRGNIYRYHIYKYKFHNTDGDLAKIPVTHFLKNTTRTVNSNDSIYHLFFAIRDLPAIAVLNDQRTFLGIIKHVTFQDYLAQAWAVNKSDYLLAIRARGYKGEFRKLTRLVNRYSDINTVISFERTEYDTESYLLVALPAYLDVVTVRGLIRFLNRHHYEVDSYQL